MARSNDFEFPALTPGQFFHKVFETGKVMVGWGRGSRSKFVQLDQAEIVNFLVAAPEMLRTDDPAVTQALAVLAAALTAGRPRYATFDDLVQAAMVKRDEQANEDSKRFAEIFKETADITTALAQLNKELASVSV
jgi:hypothetical protein